MNVQNMGSLEYKECTKQKINKTIRLWYKKKLNVHSQIGDDGFRNFLLKIGTLYIYYH